MKTIIRLFGCGLILAIFSMFSNESTAREKPGNPNIIIIYADDLGYGDLSTYGGTIPSPGIQRIADAGIMFTDFYVSAPVCTPSRYGLLTSRYPQRSLHNLTGALMPGDEGHIDKTTKILPQYLKDFGYSTALFGKWHLGNSKPEYLPCYYGFDKFVGHTHGCIDFFTHVYGSLGHDWYEDCQPLYEGGYATDLITKHAIDYLSSLDGQSPYFVYMSYNAPHYGKSDPANLPANTVVLQEGERQGVNYANTLQAPENYIERFAGVEDIYRRYYSAMVSNLDDNIAKLLDYLEKSNQLDNTIVWFISDNGGYSETNFKHASNGVLKGQKASLNEGGIRIPSALCWGKNIKPGQVISQPAANIDVLPTFLELIKPERAEKVNLADGVSLVPLILGNKSIDRDLFWKYRGNKAYRQGDWKLLDDKLFNLSDDISEENDLSKVRPDIYKELNEKWEKKEKEIEQTRQKTQEKVTCAEGKNKQLFPEMPGMVSYTYRNSFSKSIALTLDTLQELGIKDMEFSNLFGETALAIRKMLDERGMFCSSFGVSYNDLVTKTEEVGNNAKALGAKYVRVASIPHNQPFTLELAQKAVEDFNKTGKLLKEKFGLTFCYHNHGFEFYPYNGGTLFDYMVEQTNPDYVSFEIDILWTFLPGQDPAALINKYGDRFKLMHLKDLKKGVERGSLSGKTDKENDVALGSGQLDIPAILKAAKKAGIKHYYIEDESSSYSKQVPETIRYLNSLKY
ncbi:Arylsulfatase A [Mariniphaga anaerophila]|uniref:Arylsulfatase A n=1 Tax=Mariniphaga anaerophila TaxID=1484053 RepID=A0A1M5DL67_9BACT|nr:sulfatase-like hydrolase/transferase [Mariniphaga anaerophila]SHF67717.1 Arylsulfatase A [Mariniphaga anaerophila]